MRATLGSGLRELTRAFEARFRTARERGEIDASADPALLADLAGAVLHSLALRARAGDSRAALRRFSRAAVKWLCGAAAAYGAQSGGSAAPITTDALDFGLDGSDGTAALARHRARHGTPGRRDRASGFCLDA